MDIEAVAAITLMAVCLVLLTGLIIGAMKVMDEESEYGTKED